MNQPSTTSIDSPSRFWDRLLLAAVLLWAFLGMCVPMYDTDFWWHLKTGEWILSGHGIPAVDLYTFTDADKPWIDLHWGFQILITIIYKIGGVPLVTLAKATIITAAIAITWTASGERLPAWKKALVWLLPIVCIMGRAIERPEMLSQLFLSLWLWIARKSDDRPGLMWWLIPLQLIWINCHALFILGLVVGVCYGIDAVVREAARGRYGLPVRDKGPVPGEILIVALLIGLVSLINPYFEQGVMFPTVLYKKFSIEQDFYSKAIGEFQQPIAFVMSAIRTRRFDALQNIYFLSEVVTWLIAAWSFVWLLFWKREWSLFRLMLFAGYSHLAWEATRNTNIFALVAAFVACENFAAAAQLPKSGEATAPSGYATKSMIFVVAALCVLVVTGVWNQIGEKDKPFGLGERPNWYIHDAVKFAGQPGFPHLAIVSNIGQAEVYVYHNGPDHKVFMDARLEVCTEQTFKSYQDILLSMSAGSTNWEIIFRDTELPVVILDSRYSHGPLEGMLHTPTWRLVFADHSAAVFLPVKLAEKLNLPQVDYSPLQYPNGRPSNQK